MAEAIIKRETSWNGQQAVTIFEVDGVKFKTITGLRNGGGDNRCYILGNDGWAWFLGMNEIEWTSPNNASYVSDESARKSWAYALTDALMINVVEIYS